MDFEDLINEEPKDLIRVDEGQLIVAKQMQQQLIDFEKTRKEIEKKEKELKQKLYDVMKENGITKFESNDKKIMITLGEDGVTETLDKDALYLKYPDIYREFMKETPRKGALRITMMK